MPRASWCDATRIYTIRLSKQVWKFSMLDYVYLLRFRIIKLRSKLNQSTQRGREGVKNSWIYLVKIELRGRKEGHKIRNNEPTSSTGSTIRNWDKVKTCLDQMFWQIYQKLMISGFLSNGNLCLIYHLKLFWPHTTSMASDRKGAKIQHEF